MYLLGLIVYFAVLVLVGLVLSRKSLDFDSYFFGKRRLGSFLVFFTVTASWFGAASTIATVQSAQNNGFNAIWLLGIPTIFTIIIFIVISRKIRETSFVSLPLLLKKYYGKPVASIASLLIYFYMVLLAASQLVAWGKFMSYIFGENYQLAVLAGALIVILYSYLGGYLSVVFTDWIQFILLTCSLIYLILFFRNKPLHFKSTDFDFFNNMYFNLLMTISFTLAWVISPIVWQRIASARSVKASRRGLIMSVVAFSILYLIVILVGIYLREFPGRENLFGFFIKNWLPAGGSLLVFLGIAAAIMSTSDTALNISALTLVKDVFNIKNKSRIILYAKIGTFFSGLLAVLIALKLDSIIKTLGLASEIMAEGMFIPGMYALFFKKKQPMAALLSLVLGGGFSILVFLNAYAISLPLPQWPYSLPYGLGLSLLGFSLGYIIDKNR